MSKREPHPDPLVRDLKTIRRLRWSRHEDFTQLEVLFEHPLVGARAAKPKGVPERVRSLRKLLRMTKTRIKKREGDGTPRPKATAAVALLRLEPEFDGKSVEELFPAAVKGWKNENGGDMKPGTFRAHREEPDFYEPFAAAFRELYADLAERYGLDPEGDESDPDAAAEGKEGGFRHRLQAMEQESHKRRLHAIEEGTLRIRDEEEMRNVLVAVTELAESTLKAVDYNPIFDWYQPPLDAYLALQTRRARDDGIELERIRLVSEEELADRRECEKLAEFLELHEAASAKLLLCPVEAARKLEISFQPYKGLLLADDASQPLAVTGKIGDDGSVGRAFVYHETDEVGEIQHEYSRLRTTAEKHSDQLRQQLIGKA